MDGPNLPYEGSVVDALPFDKVTGKFYALDILGRGGHGPEAREWEKSDLGYMVLKQNVEELFFSDSKFDLVP